jgi:hypothetical protein
MRLKLKCLVALMFIALSSPSQAQESSLGDGDVATSLDSTYSLGEIDIRGGRSPRGATVHQRDYPGK